MKKILLAASLFLAVEFLAAFTPSFEDAVFTRKGHEVTVAYGKGRSRVSIQIFPKEHADLVTVEKEDGKLVVDTRPLFEQAGRVTVALRFQGINPADLVKKPGSETNRMTWFIKGDAGAPLELFFEGAETKGEKRAHYWRSKMALTDGKEQQLSFDQVLPAGILSLHSRLDIKGKGRFVIEKVLCETVTLESETDPARNYLWNGGAERGFYGTFMNAPEFALPEGAPQGWKSRFTIDREERYSGKASFRFDREGGNNRVYFNPVPFEYGRSAHFSAYLKAEKNCRAVMALFLRNGGAYEKGISIGTVWKKYELFIPAWGEPVEGCTKIGNLGPSGLTGALRYAFPHFTMPEGVTVWADNLAYHAGARGEYTPERGVVLSGRLDRDSHDYQSGETVKATLDFNNLNDASETVQAAWELTDFNGKILSRKKEEPVTVAPGGEAEKIVSIPLPKDYTGPVNLRFRAGEESVGFYFGVSSGEKRPIDRRVGVNYSWGNHERAAAMLADFRIGAIRHWSNDGQKAWRGFEGVEAFRRAGFYNLMCLATQPGWVGAGEDYVPRDLSGWAAETKAHAVKYRGKIDAYEILNEPNIWSGRRNNPDPAKFREVTPEVDVECIAVLGKAVREGDPATKIAGPGTCGTSIGWPVSVLAAGAAKHLDIITEHPYRALPELPDYESELLALTAAVRNFNPNYPMVATEAGYQSMVVFPDHQRIPEFARRQAAESVRLVLIGLANGLEQFHLFSFSFRDQGAGYPLTMMGGMDNRFHPVPSPVLYAVRGMIDRLYGVKPVRRVPLGSDYRCYIFDRGETRVAALWKWNGGTETLFPGEAWKGEQAFDLFGNRLNPARFELGSSPCYFESALPVEALAEKLATLSLQGAGSPLDFGVSAIDGSKFGLQVRNRTGKALSGFITANGEKVEFRDLPPEQGRLFSFPASRPIGLEAQAVSVRAEVPATGYVSEEKFALKGLFAEKCRTALKIDGRADDWPASIPAIPLTLKTKLAFWSAAEEKIEATARVAWDDDYLYLLVSAAKNSYREDPLQSPAALFKADSVQFAFDPLRNASMETQRYQDDDFEYSIGRIDGKAIVYRHCASSSTHDSFEKPLGIAEDVKAAISERDGRIIYEAAFPRRAVSPFRLEPEASMRINILLNLGNERGRAGYLELTPGIGTAPKRPGHFMDLILKGNEK